MQAKTDGHPVERAVLQQSLHTRKDGPAVNPVMQEKMVSNFCIVVGGKHIMFLIYIYIYKTSIVKFIIRIVYYLMWDLHNKQSPIFNKKKTA